ncbi:MAG: hypothetical protein QXV17_08930 [Candidatus Micrarchaeaceae archaeon]
METENTYEQHENEMEEIYNLISQDTLLSQEDMQRLSDWVSRHNDEMINRYRGKIQEKQQELDSAYEMVSKYTGWKPADIDREIKQKKLLHSIDYRVNKKRDQMNQLNSDLQSLERNDHNRQFGELFMLLASLGLSGLADLSKQIKQWYLQERKSYIERDLKFLEQMQHLINTRKNIEKEIEGLKDKIRDIMEKPIMEKMKEINKQKEGLSPTPKQGNNNKQEEQEEEQLKRQKENEEQEREEKIKETNEKRVNVKIKGKEYEFKQIPLKIPFNTVKTNMLNMLKNDEKPTMKDMQEYENGINKYKKDANELTNETAKAYKTASNIDANTVIKAGLENDNSRLPILNDAVTRKYEKTNDYGNAISGVMDKAVQSGVKKGIILKMYNEADKIGTEKNTQTEAMHKQIRDTQKQEPEKFISDENRNAIKMAAKTAIKTYMPEANAVPFLDEAIDKAVDIAIDAVEDKIDDAMKGGTVGKVANSAVDAVDKIDNIMGTATGLKGQDQGPDQQDGYGNAPKM